MAKTNFDEINAETGFENGDKFESEKQVREYFTVENMRSIFGRGQAQENQATLDQYADRVVENRRHCKF